MGRTRDIEILARTIYGEARGESFEGQIAVACVVFNRYKLQRAYWGNTVEEVCLKPHQFSCWNEGDNNRGKALAATFVENAYCTAYGIACLAVVEKLTDPTDGATFYHTDASNPSWDADMLPTITIGRHIFLKEKEKSHDK